MVKPDEPLGPPFVLVPGERGLPAGPHLTVREHCCEGRAISGRAAPEASDLVRF